MAPLAVSTDVASRSRRSEAVTQICAPAARACSVLPRVLELTYTAWDLEPFAKDCGFDGPPFRWDKERREMCSQVIPRDRDG